jgi:predicted SAM-dependent methyltransferase
MASMETQIHSDLIRLNVGCADIQLEGFMNLDLDPDMHPDRIMDCTKLREYYEPDSVDFIYCGHFLEHFPFVQSKDIVRSFYDISKPYSMCMIVVPDYRKIPDFPDQAENIIFGNKHDHKCVISEVRLLQMMNEMGFTSWPVDISTVPWCRFPGVMWQSAVIGIKHPPVRFK